MDANEIQRLAAMTNALRPDWAIKSLRTFIERNLSGRAYPDCAIALAWVATHTKTDTPRLVLEAGAWWRAASTDNSTAPRPPRREESCETCGRRETEHASTWLADHPFTPLAYATQHRSTAPTGLRTHIQPTVTFSTEETA